MATIRIRLIRNHLHTICTHNYQRVKLSTGIKLDEKFWDSANEVIKVEYPNLVRSLKSTEIQRTNGSIPMQAQKATKRAKEELSKGETLLSTYNTIVTLGFKGSYSAFFEQFKDHPSRNVTNKGSCSASLNDNQKISALSPRKISIYLSLSRFNRIQNETEKVQMRYLIKKNSLIKKLRKQVRLFKEILKEGTPDLLDNWME